MMPIKVKICGLSGESAVKAAIGVEVDYAGFVHYPASPRHVSLEKAATLISLLPESTASVIVVVDPDDAMLSAIKTIVKPTAIQLHGKETPERVAAIRHTLGGIQVIKAISIKTADDVAQAKRYEDVADMLLFDARPPELTGILPGGNGMAFDWALLANRSFSKPWFLSGGLDADNIASAIALSGATMVDVSSSVESAPGVKDPERIHSFINAARSV